MYSCDREHVCYAGNWDVQFWPAFVKAQHLCKGRITSSVVHLRLRMCVHIWHGKSPTEQHRKCKIHQRNRAGFGVFWGGMPCVSCQMCTVQIRSIGSIKNASVFRPCWVCTSCTTQATVCTFSCAKKMAWLCSPWSTDWRARVTVSKQVSLDSSSTQLGLNHSLQVSEKKNADWTPGPVF